MFYSISLLRVHKMAVPRETKKATKESDHFCSHLVHIDDANKMNVFRSNYLQDKTVNVEKLIYANYVIKHSANGRTGSLLIENRKDTREILSFVSIFEIDCNFLIGWEYASISWDLKSFPIDRRLNNVPISYKMFIFNDYSLNCSVKPISF